MIPSGLCVGKLLVMSLTADYVVLTGIVQAVLAACSTPCFSSRGVPKKEKLLPSLPFCSQHGWLKVTKQIKLIESHAEIAAFLAALILAAWSWSHGRSQTGMAAAAQPLLSPAAPGLGAASSASRGAGPGAGPSCMVAHGAGIPLAAWPGGAAKKGTGRPFREGVQPAPSPLLRSKGESELPTGVIEGHGPCYASKATLLH